MGVRVRQKVKVKGKPWWVFVAHNGKRKSLKVGSKDAAQSVAKAIQEELANNKFNIEEKREPVKVPTFKEYSQKWVNEYVKSTLSPSTYEKYEQVLRTHILPNLNHDMTLDNISRGDIKSLLISKSKEGLSRSSISVIKDVISGVFESAIDEEIIEAKNPTVGITKKLKLSDTKKKVDVSEVFNKEEVAQFLNTCKEHFPDYCPFFLMATRTGMRLGELLAVRWGDIDFNSKSIWVRQAYRKKQTTSPKGGKTRRVDMSDQLVEALKSLQRVREKEAKLMRLKDPYELIFYRGAGNIIEQNYMRGIFKRILKKAELREIKIHNLRHTFASLLLSEGESIIYVQQQLGHSNATTTLDIYSHFIQTKSKTGVNRLDAPVCTPDAPKQAKSNLTIGNY